jgi:presequence protease
MIHAELPQQNLTVSSDYHGFKLDRIQPIPELQTTGYVFNHLKSGAHCIHLYNNDQDNLFSIAFRTPVYNSTGVPHILEHSVLCGSRRYPVKDPFQEMLKGSLQTFLNALTYPDKTVYPVSSQVEKDYFNLASIYADAVFNPILSQNTFYQEGWHFDIEDVNNPVGIKGIVYNEMKGVFSNFASHVDRRTLSALFPDTTYHFESGGDPERIPDLTYEQFIEFHRRYYHPSNSYIVLYGNIPSEKTLRFLDEEFLRTFVSIDINADVNLQPHWETSRAFSFEAPAPQEDRGTATVVCAWIFGETVDPQLTLAGKILSYYLLDTESSPLKRALIDSGLGEDLADISGFDSDLRQSRFAAGLRKTKPEHAQAVEACICETLASIVADGLDFELLEGALRQIEFGLREVTGGHFPYNLRMAERCYRSWMYGGDPFAHLAFEKPLAYLKEHLEKRDSWFSDIINERLVQNTHRLCSTIVASPEMGERLERQTREQAECLSGTFTAADKEHYVQVTKMLLDQQKSPSSQDSIAKLPKLAIADLPRQGFTVATTIDSLAGYTTHLHQQFTSGIVYLDLGFDIRTIPESLLYYIPLYCEYATRCGAAGFSFEQMATRIARASGGVDASVTCKTSIGTESATPFYLFFHVKSLIPRFGETLAILHDLFTTPDLAHEKLLKDILLEERNNLHTAIIGSGHRFALTHAASNLIATRAIDEKLNGISQLRFLETLVRHNDATAVLASLQQLHKIIINRKNSLVILTGDDPAVVTTELSSFLRSLPEKPVELPVQRLLADVHTVPSGIEISSAVNFIGKVWKLPPIEPETAGKYLLLSRILSAGYLWDKVRVEGGAYGGMSMFSVAHPIFSCASYRDPNLVSTIDHFSKGLEFVAAGLTQGVIDQNIIGTIGYIDAPLPPHARCFNESILLTIGSDVVFRQKMRDAVLASTSKNLAELSANILTIKENATTILGSAAVFNQAENEGLCCKREPLIL